ncbi:lipopolysaccharide biosynthesis protein [Pseudomonas sp. GD03860]|uniref:lipopolysaccharide biosynthesis protein n=1 Tax=Pseudomonas TaxID=286 RepID=UPI0023636B54|nr:MULTISPECIES: lipopolysaccharide biosynthesis protein [Pseudomonas]MDD2059251.1 lipopolysaccharide biosynthesis protein [Pseudomonas putida]MDH0636802.1 lipopolysaccharide biosynthesis protein [Pseudomonas sp. GD03860]
MGPSTAPPHDDAFTVHNFEDCRNIRSGAVFIIASGQSAKDFPIADFSDVPMITMNGAIALFVDTPIRPFFYACTDTHFSIQQPELFAEALRRSERVALWEDHFRATHADTHAQVYFLKKAPKPKLADLWLRKDPQLIRYRSLAGCRKKAGFSKNMARGFFDARTVAYLALQIAYHAGFSKVFLVGVDLNQNLPRFYERQGIERSPCGLDQHFASRILPSFELVATSVVDERFAVYNLSASSRIPRSVIPYKTLAEVKALIQTN